jgi:hypothetical protein
MGRSVTLERSLLPQGLAASLLAILLIRPDIRVGDSQMVIRWAPSERAATRDYSGTTDTDVDLEERIRLINSLSIAAETPIATSSRFARM